MVMAPDGRGPRRSRRHGLADADGLPRGPRAWRPGHGDARLGGGVVPGGVLERAPDRDLRRPPHRRLAGGGDARAPPRFDHRHAADPGGDEQPAGHAGRAADVGGVGAGSARARRPLRDGHRRRGRQDDGAVPRARLEAVLQGARPRRHRRRDRRLRVRRRARARGGRRRLRAARRARLPDRRLPVAGQEPPHRRVRRSGRAPRPHPGGDPAGDPPAGRRRLRGLVPAQLHREPARRHDPRRLHHDRPARAGRRRRRGARVGVPRPGGRRRARPTRTRPTCRDCSSRTRAR